MKISARLTVFSLSSLFAAIALGVSLLFLWDREAGGFPDWRLALTIASTTLLLAFLCIYSILLRHGVMTPLRRLQKAVETIAGGNIDQEIESAEEDEIGELTRAFAKMTRRVRKSYNVLREEVAHRRAIENSLRESERKYRYLVDAMNEGLAILDPENRMTYVNDKLCRMLDYSREQLLGKTIFEILDNDGDRTRLRRQIKSGEEDGGGQEIAWRRQNGQTMFTLVAPRSIYDDGGGYHGCFAVVTDITPRKRAENALREEKERLAVTLRSLGEGVVATDVEGRIMLMNEAAETMTGWSLEDARGEPVENVLHLLDETSTSGENRSPAPAQADEAAENPIRLALASGVGKALDCHVLDWNRNRITISLNGAPILDDRGKIAGGVLVFRDVTSERSWEEEEIKGQKLESVGLLAGGIAHDFNNILTVIIGNVSLVRTLLEDDSRAAVLLQDIEKASTHARYLTQQLLTFSKGGAPLKELVALHEIVPETVGYVLRSAKASVKFDLTPDLWPAEVDIGQICQVFQNLVINASEAMPDGGKILLTGENRTVLTDDSLPLAPGAYVRISVEDQGRGIARENLEKVFDPYFSTKKSGIGLGLATAYSIVKRHGGYIGVDSEPGKGTRFDVYLPARRERPPQERRKYRDRLVQGEGRILVMDDDRAVRELLRRMLQTLGYEVETVENGREAIEKFRAASLAARPFDAVILDLVVPGGTGGKEAVGEIVKLDPDARVIVSSAYSNDPIMAEYRDHGFVGVAAKPYDIRQLSATLSRAIRGDSVENQ